MSIQQINPEFGRKPSLQISFNDSISENNDNPFESIKNAQPIFIIEEFPLKNYPRILQSESKDDCFFNLGNDKNIDGFLFDLELDQNTNLLFQSEAENFKFNFMDIVPQVPVQISTESIESTGDTSLLPQKQLNQQPEELKQQLVAPQIAKNYDKNICRYIMRRCIRCLIHKKYTRFVMELCNQEQSLYNKVISFFERNIEKISGFRVLKQYINIYENDSQEMIKIKHVFLEFTKWFLRERALRYIITGNMKDKQKYIEYKNQIMLNLIDHPDKWLSNKKANIQQ